MTYIDARLSTEQPTRHCADLASHLALRIVLGNTQQFDQSMAVGMFEKQNKLSTDKTCQFCYGTALQAKLLQSRVNLGSEDLRQLSGVHFGHDTSKVSNVTKVVFYLVPFILVHVQSVDNVVTIDSVG